MKIFPPLFKKTSTGAIQFWEICVEPDLTFTQNVPGIIKTTFGQLGTENPQQTSERIEAGKNIGKKNETTPLRQAEKEAEARWKKQKKKGYVESSEGAEAGEVDEIIEGGINPMLAHNFNKHGHKMLFPAYAQAKLDGIRCIAIIKDGACTLWSRTRKPITSMPHIIMELEACFGNRDIIFDGELYNHAFRRDFEHIVSLVRQEEPDDRCTDVQYHIYDVVCEGTFDERWNKLSSLFAYYDDALFGVQLVKTLFVQEHEVMDQFESARSEGYEGLILRNPRGKYVNKRSYDLLKVKEFDDAEFDIVGIEEGRGRLSGKVGAFICRTSDGKEFLAKMSGDTERLGDYFRNHGLWRGKRLTVQYQGLTGREGVPRFPVGVSIRDYE
ncbi:MAG TPA: hypothetical protein VMT62_15200 [Syntrophorhabdaceae bacterium]|nr:hypothetical protein [Syntrophorhabdaceae bacterium]